MADATLIGTIVVTGGALVTAIFTRRSARDTTAVGGFSALAKGQQVEINRLTTRVEKLEQAQAARRRLTTAHEKWDMDMVRRLQAYTAEAMPEPPPLDTWDF